MKLAPEKPKHGEGGGMGLCAEGDRKTRLLPMQYTAWGRASMRARFTPPSPSHPTNNFPRSWDLLYNKQPTACGRGGGVKAMK